MKSLFKFRVIEFGRLAIYLFERERWSIAIGLDVNEWPLFWISFIFISFELNLMKPSEYKEWKKPNPEVRKRIEEIESMSDDERYWQEDMDLEHLKSLIKNNSK